MNVLKTIAFVTLLLLGGNVCFAQEISIRGGLNLSQFNYKLGDEVFHKEGTKLNPGFNIGPIIEIPIKNIFSFETGVLFSSKGHKLSGDPLMGVKNYLFQTNMFYLNIPVLLKATIPIKKTKVFAMAGAYAGSALYGKRIAEGEENSVMKRLKANIQWGNKQNEYDRLDYGLNFSVGFKIRRCQAGASYELGFKDFSNDETFIMRNRTIALYLTYKLIEFRKKEVI